MFGRILLGLCLLLGVGLSAVAEEDDKVMGNYHGSFTGGPLAQAFVRAEVVALGKTQYKLVYYIGANEEAAKRVEVGGTRENEAAPVKIAADVDLGDAGGMCGLAANIAQETMEGTLRCKDGESTFSLKRVFVEPPTRGAAPPAGAVVLMGEGHLDKWVRDPETWCLQPDGSMKVCGSNFRTREEFGPARYHIEFMTPFMPNERGQGRGNSGVYLLGRYEVQVLDSFGDLPADNLCGGIYKKAVPTSMAALPPLQWQTYDITFYPPKYDANGTKTDDAVITVVLNGTTIHDQVVLPDVTPGGVSGQEAATGPLMLQDHNDEVSYRNIWVEPIE